MSFKDIYKKYKDGTASDKEKIMVIEELEKYKTLTDDYLDDQVDDMQTKMQDGNNLRLDINDDEINKIKKRERKRNIKLVFISVLIVCALFSAYKFAAEPLLNKYVLFNPDNSTFSKSDYHSDLRIELETLTSLHAPFVKIGYIASENTGLGKYDLTLQLINRDDNSKPEYEYGYLRNGNVKLEPFAETTTMLGSYFDVYGDNDTENDDVKKHNEEELRKLIDLQSDFTAARVAITLDDDMDMGQLAENIKKYDDLNFEWVAVICGEGRSLSPLTGMDLEGSYMMMTKDDKANDGDYPGFAEIEYTKEGLENHFMDMLEFQNDNMDLVNRIVNTKEFGSILYEGIIDYVNDNGIKAFGLIIKGNSSDIIDFYENASVKDITVRDIMLDVE